jgi:hypothetical protein
MAARALGYVHIVERSSDRHGPRLDDALAHETESLTRGAPIEARVEPSRLMEDAGDGEPMPEAVVHEAEPPDTLSLSADEVRARSELAVHLMPSRFPTDREGVLAAAEEQRAPQALLDLLDHLPAGRYENVEAVWEALGGRREHRTRPLAPEVDDAPRAHPARHTFSFAFDGWYRLAALPFGVRPENAHVSIDPRPPHMLRAHFGPWSVVTPVGNVASAETTGPYQPWKTIGPPHLSLADGGLTFATNHRRGLCIRFVDSVPGLEPLGLVRHGSLTVTVDDPDGLRAALEASNTG